MLAPAAPNEHSQNSPSPQQACRFWGKGWLTLLRDIGNTPVDGASTGSFRVIFGLLAILVVIRFFLNGWIGPLYLEPDYHFTHLGFGWVQPWPGVWLYLHFIALGLLGLGIAARYRPRLCAALFCVGFTYIELIDRTTYLNHYYLMSLVSLLLVILPMHGSRVPQWAVWALRGQVGIVYVFAGIAKLNSDWLLHALPMRIWLYQHGDMPVVGPLLQQLEVAYAMSWGGALFDLAIVPALLWRRTRPLAYGVLVLFHLATWALFPQLGVFPWLMIGLSLIFFDPGWPRRIGNFLRRPARGTELDEQPLPARPGHFRWVAAALAVLVAVQLAMPL